MNERSHPPGNFDIWGCALWIVAVILLLGVFFPAIGTKGDRKRDQAKALVLQLKAALMAHQTEFGNLPTGTNAELMVVLQGNNPRKLVLFDANLSSINSQHEVIDPWGTPILFDLSDQQNPRIWSCGKDRQDNGGKQGSDDLASWR
jgi:type II secretory pathway pseudopilin PulG